MLSSLDNARIAKIEEDISELSAGSGVVAGAGLTQTGATLDVVAADATITVNANSLQLAAAYKSKVDGIAAGATNDTAELAALTTTVAGKVAANGAITGATKTKITYDTKGLVTAGADATTADIADSSNKRYVTDAQLTVIGNTSGTNTGDAPLTIKDEGSNLTTAAASIDFVGGGVTATNTTTAVTATIPKGANLSFASVGSSPAAEGASVSTGVITLQPADATHPGVVTTAAQTIAGDKTLTGNVSMGHSTAPGFQADLGSGLANTKLALWNNAGGTDASIVGIGIQSNDVRFHGNSNNSTRFSWFKAASGATPLMTLQTGTGVLDVAASITIASVTALSQTNTVTGITNKTFTSPTINSATLSGTIATGTSTISGTPNFSGAATMGGVDLLSQTNTISGITNKTFTSPTINSGAISGTFTGNATLSGNLTLSGSNKVTLGTSTPSTPSAGLTLFAGQYGGQVPAYVDVLGVLSRLSQFAGKTHYSRPLGDGSSGATNNACIANLTGSASGATWANTSALTQAHRYRITSAATAGSAAAQKLSPGFYTTTGFYCSQQAGMTIQTATFRWFIGLKVGGFSNADPSTMTDLIGVGQDNGDTLIYFMTNDSAGTCTKTSTGLSSPGVNDLIEVNVQSVAGGTSVLISISVNGAAPTTRTETTNLPTSTSSLGPSVWANNATTASAVTTDVVYQFAYTPT